MEGLCTAGGISHIMPSSDYECTEASFGVVVTKKTFPMLTPVAANTFCADEGANVHLPTPKSADENDWYRDYLGDGEYFWIGISKIEGT